jgi:hypothetical protein
MAKTPNNKVYYKSKKTKKSKDDWISALAAQEASTTKHIIILSKEERIESRNAKKRRRDDRKAPTLIFKGAMEPDGEDAPEHGHAHGHAHGTNGSNRRKDRSRKKQHKKQIDPEELKLRSELYMNKLSNLIQDSVSKVNEGKSHKEKRVATPFVPNQGQVKGKATAGQQLSDDVIQPRKKDYGGLGLARPSLLLELRDISFIPKLEEEFAEHVVGFFGKQRTKAMKKQLDGDMLWRQLRLANGKNDGKKKGQKGKTKHDLNVRVDGKKLCDMDPDERVEAMIRLDMI